MLAPAEEVQCRAPAAELQRRAWTAGASAMGAAVEEVYFVNPEAPVALYRPCITIKVRRIVDGEPDAVVEVALATECGPLDDETQPTTVRYALTKICNTVGLGAPGCHGDEVIFGHRLVTKGARAIGEEVDLQVDLQRPLTSVGITDGDEVQLIVAATEPPPPVAAAAGVAPEAALVAEPREDGSEVVIGTDIVSRGSCGRRAGLVFPVGTVHDRIHEHIAGSSYRVGAGAPIYLAAVLEYLAKEFLQVAGNAARQDKSTRISSRHLKLAIRNDEELNKIIII